MLNATTKRNWMPIPVDVSNLSDELAAGLGALPVGRTLAFLGENPLSGGAVLQRELANDLTKVSNLYVPDRIGRLAQVQEERVKPRTQWRSGRRQGRSL